MIISFFFLDVPVIEEEKSTRRVVTYVDNPNPVILKCVADGRPPPKYQWRDQFGSTISQESTYTLVKPKSREIGVQYSCVARNKAGTSRVHAVSIEQISKYSHMRHRKPYYSKYVMSTDILSTKNFKPYCPI